MKWMIGLLVGFFLMYVMALPLFAQETKKEEPKKEEAKDEGVPAPPERPKTLEAAVKAADTIVIGAVDWMGDKPASWGAPPYKPTSVYVRYVNLKFLKGQFGPKKMQVIHELFQGSKTCAEQPGLNPAIFEIDKKVILLLTTQPYGMDTGQAVTFIPTDPDFGAMPWSEEMEKKIAGMIK